MNQFTWVSVSGLGLVQERTEHKFSLLVGVGGGKLAKARSLGAFPHASQWPPWARPPLMAAGHSLSTPPHMPGSVGHRHDSCWHAAEGILLSHAQLLSCMSWHSLNEQDWSQAGFLPPLPATGARSPMLCGREK